MSLRSVGSQLLQTTSTSLLNGAPVASVSFWIAVNSANKITAANGVELFGDVGGKFSATLSGVGSLRLQWSSNNGQVNEVSSCVLNLTPGTSYHIATTWQAGSQQYYINGIQVQPDSKLGTLGTLGAITLRPFRLGSDQLGTDVTLDEPTVWLGYALSPVDVTNLCQRSSRPQAVASSSIILRWTLAGSDGVAAKVGDPGLIDGSPSGLSLSTIVGGSPSYQAGNLSYAPSPMVGSAAIAPSGKSLVLIFQDGAGNSSNLASLSSSGEVQNIAINAILSKPSFTVSFGGQTTAPIPVATQRPIGSVSWEFPVKAGHSYKVAGSRNYANGGTSSHYFYEVFDGLAMVASVSLDGHANSSQFTDPGVTLYNGNLVPWDLIASGVVPTGTTLRVQLAASTDGFMIADALRVEDTTAGTVTHYACNDSTCSTNPPGPQELGPAFATGYLGQSLFISPQGSTDRCLVVGGSAAVQTALQALSTIGSSGVTVNDLSGNGNGSYEVHFTGILANLPQPLLTATDPAITITRTNAGGVSPILTITPKGGPPGSPIALHDVLWGAKLPYSPVATFPLPQSAPNVQTLRIGQQGFGLAGDWTFAQYDPTSASGSPLFSHGAGAAATYNFTLLPAGSYRFAATWSTTPINFYGQLFQPSAATQYQIKDGLGNVLESVTIDQTQAPADYTANGRGWKWIGGSHATNPASDGLTLSVMGDGQSGNNVAVADAAQFARTSADASIVAHPTDTITVTLPDGWATTSAGVVPGVIGQVVAPPSPSTIMPPFVPSTKSTKIGYNIETTNYYDLFPSFSNLATRIGYTAGLVAGNDNGYPTKIQGGRDANGRIATDAIISTPPANHGGTWDGMMGLPSGLYVMLWDGDASHQLDNYDNKATVTEVVSYQILTGSTGNRRVYNIQALPNLAFVGFSLQIHGHAADPTDSTGNTDLVNLSNLRIYPPDPADPTGNTIWLSPPKFHPTFLYKLQGAQCLRFLDPLATNNNTWTNLSHFKPTTYLGRSYTHLDVAPKVVGVKEPVGDRFFTPSNRVVQITTDAPHGLFDGAWLTLHSCGTANFSDGSSNALDNRVGVAKVVDATNLLFICDPSNGPHVVMTNTLSPTNGSFYANRGTIWPIEDIIDLVAASKVPELWFNVAATADVSVGGGVDQVFGFLAAHLPSGVKVHVEHGNECWNFGFPTYYWNRACNSILKGQDDGSYQVYYANKAKAVHDRAQAVFTAAGRPNDIIYTYATFGSNAPYATAGIIPQAKLNGARVDELAVGNYFDNWDAKCGFEDAQIPIYNKMTPDHLLDFLEVNVEYGRHETIITDHLPILAANGYASTKMVCYEAAPDILIPGTNPANAPGDTPLYHPRQNAVKRHPRMFGIMLRTLQKCQDAGLNLWNHFNIGGGSGPYAWDAYEWYNQKRGTGDPVLDAINIANPIAMDQVVSEVGGALTYWSSLTPTIINPVSKKLLPGRNGQVRSTGLPRGMSRPIR